MRARASALALGLYERAAARGLLERPSARRAFESAYLGYKRLVEAGPVGHLRAVVPPGSSVVDVGANIGFFAIRFAGWVGPGGRVIAIEPEARNAEALRRRVAGGVVEVHRAAAADVPGELRLALNPLHPGDHHLAEKGELVRAVTVDELCADDPRPVALLKIDVQGAEGLVLTGAAETIAAHRPALFIELDAAALARFGSSVAELVGRLEALGYAGHRLSRAGIGPLEPAAALIARAEAGYIDVLFR